MDSTLAGLLAFKTARDMGCRVTFVEPLDSSFLPLSTTDASRIVPHLVHVHEHIKLQTLGDGALTRAIGEISKTNKVDATITTSEAAILPVAQAAEDCGLLSPGRSALEVAVFKDRCRAALKRAGLLSPEFEVMSEDQLVSGTPKRIPAPLVVKPTRGFGKQFRQQAATEQYMRDVFKAVGVEFGLYHVELLWSPDGPCLVEINGRMMGGVGPQVYRSVSGRDAFELLTRLHLGENVAPEQREIQGAATVLLIGAKEPGAVSASFTQDRFDSLLHRYGIAFCTLKLRAGMPVRRFEGNLSVLGHVIVPAADVRSSERKGRDFLTELDALLGFEVAKYAAPGPVRGHGELQPDRPPQRA
jgi:biotin carboxylase